MGRVSRQHNRSPSFPFYVKDWTAGDCGLAACSLAAQGLWARLLCFMHNAPERGALAGNLITLANIAGRSREECAPLLQELERNHVYSWADGLQILEERAPREWIEKGHMVIEPWPGRKIINRKFFREYRISVIRADAGRKGGNAIRVEGEANGQQTPKQKPSKTLANGQQNGQQKEIPNVGQILELQGFEGSKTEPKQPPSDPDLRSYKRSDRQQSSPSSKQFPGAAGHKGKPADPEIGIAHMTLEAIRTADAETLINIVAKLDSGKNAARLWANRIGELQKHAGGLDTVVDGLANYWHSIHPERGGGVGAFKNFAAYLNKETSKWLKERRRRVSPR